MRCDFANRQKVLTVNKKIVAELAKFVIQYMGVRCDELSFHFVTDEELCQLHAEFFNDPSKTDCITFPIDSHEDEGYIMLGEVFISPQAAVDYANEHNSNPYDELTLYIIHGILHLLGYDDIEETDRLLMHSKQDEILIAAKEKGVSLR